MAEERQAVSGATAFERRVNGEISTAQYVKYLDDRVRARRHAQSTTKAKRSESQKSESR